MPKLSAKALEIDIEGSLSAFVKRVRGFATGREIRMFKYQLACLSTATVRLAMFQADRALAINTHVITSFDLWLPKDERQRVLWPSTVSPFPKNILKACRSMPCPSTKLTLRHSHIRQWVSIFTLGWRSGCTVSITFIVWTALKEQFGPDYDRMDNFKRFFRKTFAQVQRRYQTARLELDNKGMTARISPPPVGKRLVLLNSSARS